MRVMSNVMSNSLDINFIHRDISGQSYNKVWVSCGPGTICARAVPGPQDAQHQVVIIVTNYSALPSKHTPQNNSNEIPTLWFW